MPTKLETPKQEGLRLSEVDKKLLKVLMPILFLFASVITIAIYQLF